MTWDEVEAKALGRNTKVVLDENGMKVNTQLTDYGKKFMGRFGLPVWMGIKKVVFNDPATIVFWADGTKTVVKCSELDIFDCEKGLAMAVASKLYGDEFHTTFRKALKEAEITPDRQYQKQEQRAKKMCDGVKGPKCEKCEYNGLNHHGECVITRSFASGVSAGAIVFNDIFGGRNTNEQN